MFVNIAYAPFYFISLQIVQAFIIQSLFILVILQSLDDNEENPEISFKKLLKDFRYNWNEYTYKTFHKKINSQDLIPFFKDLHKDLGKYTLIAKIKIITKKKGFSELTVQQIGVEIMKMNLERYFY